MIKEKTKEDPLVVFNRAMENVKPLVEVKPRRVGGATYQVPVQVRPERGTALAMRWIIHFAREKTGKPISERLGRRNSGRQPKRRLGHQEKGRHPPDGGRQQSVRPLPLVIQFYASDSIH